MDMKKEKDIEGLAPSQTNDVHPSAIHNHDDVFGEITESGPNYRNVRFSFLFFCSFPSVIYQSLFLFFSLFFPPRKMSNWVKINTSLGRMGRNSDPHDEESDWPRCPFHPSCV